MYRPYVSILATVLAIALLVGATDQPKRIARYPCNLNLEGRCNGPMSLIPAKIWRGELATDIAGQAGRSPSLQANPFQFDLSRTRRPGPH